MVSASHLGTRGGEEVQGGFSESITLEVEIKNRNIVSEHTK